jgi:hypothetical protein
LVSGEVLFTVDIYQPIHRSVDIGRRGHSLCPDTILHDGIQDFHGSLDIILTNDVSQFFFDLVHNDPFLVEEN